MINQLELESFFDPVYAKAPDDLPAFKMFVDRRWMSASGCETYDVNTLIDESIIVRAQSATIQYVKKANGVSI